MIASWISAKMISSFIGVGEIAQTMKMSELCHNTEIKRNILFKYYNKPSDFFWYRMILIHKHLLESPKRLEMFSYENILIKGSKYLE